MNWEEIFWDAALKTVGVKLAEARAKDLRRVVLIALAATALLRVCLAVWRWHSAPERTAAVGAGLAGALAFSVLLVPTAAPILGGALAVVALVTALITKLENFTLGACLSSFTATKEIRGALDTER